MKTLMKRLNEKSHEKALFFFKNSVCFSPFIYKIDYLIGLTFWAFPIGL